MPGRHSLFWRLCGLLCLGTVLIVGLSWVLTREAGDRLVLLDADAKSVMRDYADEAWHAWRQDGEAGVARWLAWLREREPGEAFVVDGHGRSLSGHALSAAQSAGQRFQRELDWRMSFRSQGLPFIGVPFPADPDAGRLVMQLPPRFMPGGHWPLLKMLLLVVMPALLALLAGVLIYWRMVAPLRQLRARVLRFRHDPAARVGQALTRRRDEFGQLGRGFNQMAEQVAGNLEAQRRLLRDLSHELRTPLGRLSVALESDLDEAALRRRLAREVALMRSLVEDSLALAWHDAQPAPAIAECLDLAEVWELVADNAAFESGWPAARLPCRLPPGARVHGNLNELAQALENLVRNAVRHSPPGGRVSLEGHRHGAHWRVWVADQGPGVPDTELERIFEPFVRLDRARAVDRGFGLGLSIARRILARQGGHLWAENGHPGLHVHLSLPAWEDV